jgi:hypothetical protein
VEAGQWDAPGDVRNFHQLAVILLRDFEKIRIFFLLENVPGEMAG